MSIREKIALPIGFEPEEGGGEELPSGFVPDKKKIQSGSVSQNGTSNTSQSKSSLSSGDVNNILGYIKANQSPEEKIEKQRQLKDAGAKSHPITVEPTKEQRLDKEQAQILAEKQQEDNRRYAKQQSIDQTLKDTGGDLTATIFTLNGVKNPDQLSNTKKAEIIDKTLSDPEFQDRIKTDDRLSHEAAVMKNTLPELSIDYTLKKVEQKIGQHIQDSGKNKIFFQGASEEDMDKIVDDLVANGKMSQQERAAYMKNKDTVAGWVKYESPDVVHSFQRGLQSGAADVESTFRDIGNKVTGGLLQKAGLIETNEDRQKRQDEEQDVAPVIEPKSNTAKAIKNMFGFTGYAAPMIINAALTKGAGFGQHAAETVPALLQFEGKNAENSRRYFEGDEAKQLSYTALGTLIDVTLGKMLPANKAAASILKKDALNSVRQMTGDIATDAAVKKSFLNKFTGTIGEIAKHNATTGGLVTAFEGAHDVVDAVFGQRDMPGEEDAKKYINTFMNTFVAATPLSLGITAMQRAGVSPKLQGERAVNIAENPEQHIEEIRDEAAKNDEPIAETEKKVAAIKDASKAWGVIKDLQNLNDAQKEKFFVKDLQQKELDQQAREAPVDVVKEDLQNKANEAYADKVKIYSGADEAKEHETFTPKEAEPEPERQKLIEEAAKHGSDITMGIYKDMFKGNEEEVLKEFAAQLNASPTEAATARRILGDRLSDIALKLFPGEKVEVSHELNVANEEGQIPVTTEGEVAPTEESIKTQQPTEEGAGGEIIPPTEKPVSSGTEESQGGITHAATADTREQLGLPEYEGRPVETHEELRDYAKKAIGEDPTIADKTMTKIEKGGKVTNKDNAILSEYKAALDYKLENNPTKETFEQVKRLINVLEPSGTELGKALESRKLLSAKEDNLTNFLIDKQTAQGTELSDKQIVEQTEQYKELKKAKDDLQTALDIEVEKNKKLVAEKELSKQAKKTSKSQKKTKEDFTKEREQIWDHLKKKWDEGKGRTSATILPYADRLADIAPDVAKLVKSHLEEGINKLDDIATSIFEKAKEVIPEIRKSDIYDIIAGNYDVKKKTYNEITAEARLLKREAKLMDELAKARKGEESEKNERRRVEKSRRIDELEKQIKEVREQNKANLEEPVEDVTAGKKNQAERLAAKKKELLNKIDKLNNDLKNKNFLKEKPEEPALKLDNTTRKLMDRVIELERKRNIELDKDEYSKRSKFQKAYDKVMEVAGIRRIVQSAVDLSIPFRQGASLISPRRIDTWVKSFGKMMHSAFNQKNYDRLMYGIRHSDNYHEMIKDGITFNDLDSIKPEQRNEDFQKSFIYKIPYLSAPLIASNRAADAFLNVARYDLYTKFARNLEREGKTRQSDPKEYEAAAKWAMNMTGRGNLLKAAESGEAQKLLGNTFYGARLMASRFNMLNPITYAKMPPSVRLEAIKDITTWAATTMAVGYALSNATGSTIALNPDDSDFLQLRHGDKVYDLSGGMAIYLRTYLRIAEAAYKKVNPNATKFEANKAVENAGQSTVRFFRNKLAPNTAYGVDAFFGKPGGQKFNPLDVVSIYPMYVDDVKKALKEDGPTAFATVLLPNLLGVGYGNYATKGSVDTDLQTLLERNLRSDESNKETIKNYKDGGRDITNKEFNEYVDKRDEKIKDGIEKMYNEGLLVVDNGKVVKKPYNQLTREQVVKETSSIKSKATKEVKEELFGKDVETREEKRAEKLLKKAKKREENN